MAGDPFDVTLIGDTGEMAEAVAFAGGRVVARLEWGEPLAPQPGSIVALDLSGKAAMDLTVLSALHGADLIVCDFDHLDLIAGAVLLTDTHLLCEPTMADRIASLSSIAVDGSMADAVREGDSARLRRFSAEVGRIAGTLARLAADQGPSDVADRRPAYDPGPAMLTAVLDPSAVRRALRARRLRATMFGDFESGGLFEDPAWDMLLDLFAAELEGAPVSVSSLCIAAAVAPTTALRWIGRLTQIGLFERRPDPQDRRRAFMALTPRGSATMRGYVAALERAGLALG